MKWTVHTLDLGEVELNTRRLIPNEQKRDRMVFPVQGWLLTSGDTRVVIDTGFRSPEILRRIGDAEPASNPLSSACRPS